MQISSTQIPEVLVITPKRFGDGRGYFSETYNKTVFENHGINIEFVQDNHSFSAEPSTVRGLHFQSPPYAQDKLVRVSAGRILDVAVDARLGSPTYGKWVAEELSAENGKQLLVPIGFLHGFATLEPNTEVLYKCSAVYAPDHDGGVKFDDPDLGIDWMLSGGQAIVSDKDAIAQSFANFRSPFQYEG